VFDSLALPHVHAFKILREYLVDEAKAKRGMDIAKDDIAGLHAKVLLFIELRLMFRSLNRVITVIAVSFCYIT